MCEKCTERQNAIKSGKIENLDQLPDMFLLALGEDIMSAIGARVIEALNEPELAEKFQKSSEEMFKMINDHASNGHMLTGEVVVAICYAAFRAIIKMRAQVEQSIIAAGGTPMSVNLMGVKASIQQAEPKMEKDPEAPKVEDDPFGGFELPDKGTVH